MPNFQYQDPYSAFGGGLAGGFQMGTQIWAMKEERARRKLEGDIQKLNISLNIMQNDNLPDAAKTDVYNNTYIPIMNRLNPQTQYTPMSSWETDASKSMRRLKNIMDDKDMSLPSKLGMLNEMETETSMIGKKIDISHYRAGIERDTRERELTTPEGLTGLGQQIKSQYGEAGIAGYREKGISGIGGLPTTEDSVGKAGTTKKQIEDRVVEISKDSQEYALKLLGLNKTAITYYLQNPDQITSPTEGITPKQLEKFWEYYWTRASQLADPNILKIMRERAEQPVTYPKTTPTPGTPIPGTAEDYINKYKGGLK